MADSILSSAFLFLGWYIVAWSHTGVLWKEVAKKRIATGCVHVLGLLLGMGTIFLVILVRIHQMFVLQRCYD